MKHQKTADPAAPVRERPVPRAHKTSVSAKDELQDRADHATVDNPGYDGTDAAHPAWWRGEEHGSDFTADVLRGVAENGKVGTYGGERVERAALAIEGLRLKIAAILATATAVLDVISNETDESYNYDVVEGATAIVDAIRELVSKSNDE